MRRNTLPAAKIHKVAVRPIIPKIGSKFCQKVQDFCAKFKQGIYQCMRMRDGDMNCGNRAETRNNPQLEGENSLPRFRESNHAQNVGQVLSNGGK